MRGLRVLKRERNQGKVVVISEMSLKFQNKIIWANVCSKGFSWGLLPCFSDAEWFSERSLLKIVYLLKCLCLKIKRAINFWL